MLRPAIAMMLLLPALAMAQPERYELGKRLKAFEQAWEKQTDPAARKRALEILPQATTKFFALNLPEAGRALDEARWRLESKDAPSDAVKWLTSLYAVPEKRLYDASENEIKVEIKHFYKVKSEWPVGAILRIDCDRKSVVIDKPQAFPILASLPMPIPGDHQLFMRAYLEKKTGLKSQMTITVIKDLPKELLKLKSLVDLSDPKDPAKRTIQGASLRSQVERLDELASGEVLEIDYPASLFLENTHLTVLKQQSDLTIIPKDFAVTSVNQFSSMPIGKTSKMPYRIGPVSPAVITAPTPLVIALHGAGGTENLFFEGYGDGQIVKECEKRRWIVVSPRSGLNFIGGPPVKKLIEELSKRYPIDPARIFLVGHSMGAMQAITLAQEHPKLFAGIAVLGGGGTVKDAKVFANLPTFIGVGTKDFAVPAAKALKKALTEVGAKAIAYKEFPDLEHLIIVREALPDAFAMFDRIGAAKK